MPTKPITGIPTTVPINHKGILPVVFAIYLILLFQIYYLVKTQTKKEQLSILKF
jgi:hypothetical protein